MSKVLKVVGIGCGGCLVLIIAAALIIYTQLPSEIHVERSIQIEAPVEVVFPLVDTMKSWEQWDPWTEADPDMERTYEGPPAGVGAKNTWKSTNRDVGEGWLVISESVTGERVVFDLHIMEGGEDQPGTGTFTFTSTDTGTRVKWEHDAQLEGTSMRVFGLVADMFLGTMFDTGLGNLKRVSEARVAKLGGGALPTKDELEGAMEEAVDNAIDKIEKGLGEGE